jgi:hypothetical protein
MLLTFVKDASAKHANVTMIGNPGHTFMNRASSIPANTRANRYQYPPMQGSSESMNPHSETADFAIALAGSTS